MSRLPAWIGQHLAAVRAIIVMTVITGALYPLAMLGIGQAAFHSQANGSLVSVNGKVVGSSLLCQEFADSHGNPLVRYFQPRPSTASSSTDKTDYGCDPLYSGASNLGTNNAALLQSVQARRPRTRS
jgi:potassium-transporting ATPase KdpC subunit